MDTSKGRFAHHQVGAVRVTTVADGVRRMALPDGFVLNAGRAEINAALQDAGLPQDELTIHFNPVVIETAGRRALIDTGMGAAAALAPDATNGFLLHSLAAAGIEPASIDTVVISHFHGDHVNGLLTPDGAPSFPGAAVLVPEPEWTYWMNDRAMAAAPPGRMAQLFQANRRIFGAVMAHVQHYAWGEEVLPGVTAIGTPGHTMGHTSFLVESGGERLFVQSDVTNNPALFVAHPGWHAGFDQDPAQAEATRRDVLGRAAAERLLVQGFHFPFPGRGRIETTDTGFRLVPVG